MSGKHRAKRGPPLDWQGPAFSAPAALSVVKLGTEGVVTAGSGGGTDGTGRNLQAECQFQRLIILTTAGGEYN